MTDERRLELMTESLHLMKMAVFFLVLHAAGFLLALWVLFTDRPGWLVIAFMTHSFWCSIMSGKAKQESDMLAKEAKLL
jgi:hypothetical protein